MTDGRFVTHFFLPAKPPRQKDGEWDAWVSGRVVSSEFPLVVEYNVS